jgi:hypothetical protein
MLLATSNVMAGLWIERERLLIMERSGRDRRELLEE